jgi:hypothetical protein
LRGTPGGLTGARHSRADQLVRLIEDSLAFTKRLSFIVEGDVRADQIGTE